MYGRGYKLDDEVIVRDNDDSPWIDGVVVSLDPLRVKCDNDDVARSFAEICLRCQALWVGARVTVVHGAIEYEHYKLEQGSIGIVEQIDENEDALIRWQAQGKKWVLYHQRWRLEVQAAPRLSAKERAKEEKAKAKEIPSVHFKTVVVGKYSVGKSSLAVRFVKGTFTHQREPSIGATFMTRSVMLDDMQVKLEIWDTAGQERYKALAPMYYRGAAATVVVFDITRKDTWEAARSWVGEVREEANCSLVVLVGNKCDLFQKRVVDRSTAESYAKKENLVYMETSAMTGESVGELFHAIAVELSRRHAEGPEGFDASVHGRLFGPHRRGGGGFTIEPKATDATGITACCPT